MDKLTAIFSLVFGCHHRQLSRVFTISGRTYRVCCSCGTKFDYCLKTMSVKRGLGYQVAG